MSAPGRRRARLLGPALAVTLAVMTVLLGNGVASAHAYLRGSDPADGSTVQTLPATVTLDFNETIQNFEPVVVVTGPDGRNYVTGPVSVVGNAVSTAVSTDGPSGAYSLAYRVVSADGHPVTGEVKFSVTASPSSNPGPSGASSSSSAGAGTSGSTTPRSSTRAPSTTSTPGTTGSSRSTVGSSASTSSQTPGSSGSSSAAVSAGPSSPAATDPAAASPAQQQPSSGPDWWIWVAIAVAAVILAIAGFITLRRPHED